MDTTASNLSYEFYYLLRTEIEQDDHSWREPSSLSTVQSPRITQEGIFVDNDKRLFRSDAFEDWPQNLKSGKIQRYYIEQFAKQDINETQAQAFCSQALLGVALLISDASLESHTITVPLQGAEDQVVFKPDTWLLQVVHTLPEDSDEERMPTPAIFARFVPQCKTIQQHKHWQLRLDLATPQLAPMEITTDTANPVFAPNPVFAVYGLAHGDLDNLGQATWPQQLQDFLVGGEPALLVRVLPRLLVREWQFNRMDLAAFLVRKHLRARSSYRNQANLPCLSSRELSYSIAGVHRIYRPLFRTPQGRRRKSEVAKWISNTPKHL